MSPTRARTLAEFEGVFDPSTRRIELTRAETGAGLVDLAVANDGVPGPGPADTVELETRSTAEGSAGCGLADSVCGVVRLRSFYGAPVEDVWVELTQILPVTAALVRGGDAPTLPGLDDRFGLWAYGDLGPAGSGGDFSDRTWTFQLASQQGFRFRGRVRAPAAPGADAGLPDGGAPDAGGPDAGSPPTAGGQVACLGLTDEAIVSRNGDGAPSDLRTDFEALSRDGRFLAFTSSEPAFGPWADPFQTSRLHVRDLHTGRVETLDLVNESAELTVALSATGEFLVTVERWHDGIAWRHELRRHHAGVPSLLRSSRASITSPSVSADGAWVVFVSDDVNLGSSVAQVYLLEVASGAITRVSRSAALAPGNGASSRAMSSPDARFVVFTSAASNLVPGDTNARGDVFRFDRTTGELVRVSLGAGGEQGNQASIGLQLTDDGEEVLFLSAATTLDPTDLDGAPNHFVKNLTTGTLARLEGPGLLDSADWCSGLADLSADGTALVYCHQSELRLHDRTSGTTRAISTAIVPVIDADTGIMASPPPDPRIAGDGTFVVYGGDEAHVFASPAAERPAIEVHCAVAFGPSAYTTKPVPYTNQWRQGAASASAGDRAYFFGGRFNAIDDLIAYDRAEGAWQPIAAPAWVRAGLGTSLVATPEALFAFGGLPTPAFGTDSHAQLVRYDLDSGAFSELVAASAPSSRFDHAAAFTGAELVIWGGSAYVGGVLGKRGDGARFDVAAGTWAPMSMVSAPSPRAPRFGGMIGDEFVVYGEDGADGNTTGARYDLDLDQWTPMSTAGAPAADVVVALGGRLYALGEAAGAVYDPATDQWSPISIAGAPAAPGVLHRVGVAHAGLLVVLSETGETAAYDPTLDAWIPMIRGRETAEGMLKVVALGPDLLVWHDTAARLGLP